MYTEPHELIRICHEQNDYDHILIITNDTTAYIGMLEGLENIHFIDMGSLSIDEGAVRGGNPIFCTSLRYYTELSNLILDNAEFNCCFLMSMKQGEIMRELFVQNVNFKSMFQHIKSIDSEISAAYMELMDLLTSERYDRVYLTDYKLALGAVKLLLLKPELLHSKVSVFFYNYDSVFEDFGLPVKTLPFALLKSGVEEYTGTVFKA